MINLSQTVENSAGFARARASKLSSVLSYTIAQRDSQSGEKMRCYPRFGCYRRFDSILPEQGVYNGTYFVLSASRTSQPFTEVNWVVCTLLHGLNLHRSAHLIRKYISYSVQKKKKQFLASSFFVTGNDLSSRAVSSQVLSALKGLTSVFGMRTGGSPSPLSPVSLNVLLHTHNCIVSILS